MPRKLRGLSWLALAATLCLAACEKPQVPKDAPTPAPSAASL